MSIAALTTVFTPAPSCLAPTNVWKISASCPLPYACYYFLQGPPSQANCFPTGYEPSPTAYYSPGRCPQGYTPACSQVNPTGSVTETTQTCCPSIGVYSCQTSPLDMFPWQATLGCYASYSASSTINVIASQSGSTSTQTEVVGTTDAINAYGVVVRFQASDFSPTLSVSSTVLTSMATQTTLATQPVSTESISTTQSLPANYAGGLTSAAIAGIVVGALLGGIVLTVAIFMAFLGGFRYSRKKAQEKSANEIFPQQPPVENAMYFVPYAEMDGQGLTYTVSEMDGSSVGTSEKNSVSNGVFGSPHEMES